MVLEHRWYERRTSAGREILSLLECRGKASRSGEARMEAEGLVMVGEWRELAGHQAVGTAGGKAQSLEQVWLCEGK